MEMGILFLRILSYIIFVAMMNKLCIVLETESNSNLKFLSKIGLKLTIANITRVSHLNIKI